jgi:thiol-disulfide isomerase/thioredoxin
MEQQPLAESEQPRRFGIWVLPVIGLLAGVVMAAAVIFSGGSRRSGGASLPTPIPDLVVEGQLAPDFTTQTLDGEDMRLSDYRGSVVAINFWATWCAPCKVEMPVLQEAHDAGKLIVLGVNAGESTDLIRPYIDELGLSFPILLDPEGRIVDLYAIRVFPTTVILDPQGVVIAEHLGILTPELIDDYLAEVSAR